MSVMGCFVSNGVTGAGEVAGAYHNAWEITLLGKGFSTAAVKKSWETLLSYDADWSSYCWFKEEAVASYNWKKMVDEKIVEGVFGGYPCWSRL